MACTLPGLLATQGALISAVPEDPAAVSRWVSKCHLAQATAVQASFSSERSIDTHCVSSGWQSGSMHSWWIGLPEGRVASSGLGKVQYYSTSGGDKGVPPQSPSSGPPSAEQVLSAATQGSAPLSGIARWGSPFNIMWTMSVIFSIQSPFLKKKKREASVLQQVQFFKWS